MVFLLPTAYPKYRRHTRSQLKGSTTSSCICVGRVVTTFLCGFAPTSGNLLTPSSITGKTGKASSALNAPRPCNTASRAGEYSYGQNVSKQRLKVLLFMWGLTWRLERVAKSGICCVLVVLCSLTLRTVCYDNVLLGIVGCKYFGVFCIPLLPDPPRWMTRGKHHCCRPLPWVRPVFIVFLPSDTGKQWLRIQA